MGVYCMYFMYIYIFFVFLLYITKLTTYLLNCKLEFFFASFQVNQMLIDENTERTKKKSIQEIDLVTRIELNYCVSLLFFSLFLLQYYMQMRLDFTLSKSTKKQIIWDLKLKNDLNEINDTVSQFFRIICLVSQIYTGTVKGIYSRLICPTENVYFITCEIAQNKAYY